jgi:hypothetical protein
MEIETYRKIYEAIAALNRALEDAYNRDEEVTIKLDDYSLPQKVKLIVETTP